MKICHFCKKRVWPWQRKFWGNEHHDCYAAYLQDLANNSHSSVSDVFPDADKQYREFLLRELRDVRDQFPTLGLRVPLE